MEVSPDIQFPDPEQDAILALFVGRRKSGKSALFVDMLATVWKQKWHLIVVLSKTWKHQKIFKVLQGKIIHFEHWSPDIFDMLITTQQEHPKRRVMLFIDDMSEEGRTETQGINEFAFIGRHFRISVVWLVQRLGLATPGFRQESDMIVLFREENPRELRLIYMEWGLVDYDPFVQTIKHYTDTPYTFIVFINIKGIVKVFTLPDNPSNKHAMAEIEPRKRRKVKGEKKMAITEDEKREKRKQKMQIDYQGIPNIIHQ